jgi:hypothetical protein
VPREAPCDTKKTFKEAAMKPVLLALLSASLAAPLAAQEVAEAPASPEAPALEPQPPDIPAPVEGGEPLEPEVTIIESARGTVEEYRVGGQLYMVKVTPTRGPAYYLLDTDGDGQLDARSDDPGDASINQWVLFRW